SGPLPGPGPAAAADGRAARRFRRRSPTHARTAPRPGRCAGKNRVTRVMTNREEAMAYPNSERAPEERAPADLEGRTTNQARQAVTGHKVRYVLYWGLGGLIVIYAAIYFFFLR